MRCWSSANILVLLVLSECALAFQDNAPQKPSAGNADAALAVSRLLDAIREWPPKWDMDKPRWQELIDAVKTFDNGQAAIRPLSELLSDSDANARFEAARALGELGPNARESTEPLTRALTDTNKFVAAMAAYGLGRIGTGAKGAEEHLQKLVNQNYVGFYAKWALARISGDRQPEPKQIPRMWSEWGDFAFWTVLGVLGAVFAVLALLTERPAWAIGFAVVLIVMLSGVVSFQDPPVLTSSLWHSILGFTILFVPPGVLIAAKR